MQLLKNIWYEAKLVWILIWEDFNYRMSSEEEQERRMNEKKKMNKE